MKTIAGYSFWGISFVLLIAFTIRNIILQQTKFGFSKQDIMIFDTTQVWIAVVIGVLVGLGVILIAWGAVDDE